MVATKLRQHCWLFWSASVGIFFLAICRYWIPYVPSDSVPNNIESFRLALNLAHSGRFADPYLIPSGPSAHMAPAFPFLLSLLVRIFGDGSAGIYAIKLSAIFVLSLQLALFPLFAETLGMNASAGFIAAILWIAAKVGLMVERDHPLGPVFNWESLYAALLVSVLLYGCRRWMDDAEDDRVAISWLIGVMVGLLVMTSPTSVIIFGGWFIWMAYRERHHHFGRTFAVIALIPSLLTLAWLLRNYLVFDRPVFVRDNFG